MQEEHAQLAESDPATPAPVVAIAYADTRTDRGRRHPLSPDLIEARIAANAIGGGFLLAGFLFLCVLGMDNSWLLTAMAAAAYVLPGGALLWAAYLIKKRRKAGVVVATAGGCWVMLAMAALATAELVALLRTDRPVGYPWFRVLIHLLFLGLAAKLAFHAFRAALFTGRSGDAGVAVWLTPEGAMPRLPLVSRVMLLVSLGSQLLLLAAAGGCWYLATALKTPMPAPPPFTPYVGNLNLPPPNGLGPSERAAVAGYLRGAGLGDRVSLLDDDDRVRLIDIALRDQAARLFPEPKAPIDENGGLEQVLAIEVGEPPHRYRGTPIEHGTYGSLQVHFRQGSVSFTPHTSSPGSFAIGALRYSHGSWSFAGARQWSVFDADSQLQQANARLGGRIRDQQGRALVPFATSTLTTYADVLPASFMNATLDADGNLRATTPKGDCLVTPAGQVLDADQDDRDRERRAGRWTRKLDLNPGVPTPLAWCALAGVLLALWPLLHRRSIERLPVVWAFLRLALLGASVLAALWLLSSIFVTALESTNYGSAVAATIVSTVLAILIVGEGIWFPLILVQSARIFRRGSAEATAPPRYPF